jgi:hypothetical protein
MREILSILREIAAKSDHFLSLKDSVVFSRGGVDWELRFKHDPELGWIIDQVNGKDETRDAKEYIRNEILGIGRLSSQIAKYYKRKFSQKGPIITAPISLDEGSSSRLVDDGISALKEIIISPLPFETKLIFVMAQAGQGKTALLDKVSDQLCNNYTPTSLSPILLNVDLLGRFIGTFDDAIAGTLNNTYEYPSLKQSDVVACIKNNWISLALDGFDELVSRIGSRDAFLKLSELISQLDGRGNLVLSARQSFFDLPSIQRDMQKYLNPLKGDFDICNINLRSWQRDDQKRYVLECARSCGADEDPSIVLDRIIGFFGPNGDTLLSTPFFFSKICELWFSNSFTDAGTQESNKIHYVINQYIQREAQEKWISKEGNQLIPQEVHTSLLSDIAVVFWNSSSGCIPIDDLEIYALVSVEHLGLSTTQRDEIKTKIATHAVFESQNGLVKFSHIQFQSYYLARAIANIVGNLNDVELEGVINSSELMPEVLDWFDFWIKHESIGQNREILTMLSDVCLRSRDLTTQVNVANISTRFFNCESGDPVCIQKAVFHGECIPGDYISSIIFKDCTFTSVSFSLMRFDNTEFKSCVFSGVNATGANFNGVKFDSNCRFDSVLIEVDSELTPRFDTNDIEKIITDRGGVIEKVVHSIKLMTVQTISLSEEVKFCVTRMLKKANKQPIFSSEEIEEEDAIQVDIRKVCRLGVDHGILKESSRAVAGKKRHFFRFIVDREKVRDGLSVVTGDKRIDKYIDALSTSF